MNYKILYASFLVAFATACSTEPTNEDDLTRHNQQTHEEAERSRVLIDSLNDTDRRVNGESDLSSSTNEPVIVSAGNQQSADKPVSVSELA
ncbi:MAG: hypothetical protein ACI8ZT_002199, partial [Bacteroidia bacterium]